MTNPEDHAIVSSVINLAHSLDLHVIAEGVEDAAQLEELRGMGCDQAQGFYWRVPPPSTRSRRGCRRAVVGVTAMALFSGSTAGRGTPAPPPARSRR